MTSIHPFSSQENPLSHVLTHFSALNKDPWLAANLSLFFPGIGQFYARKFGKAIIFFVGQIILLITGLWSIFAPKGQIITGLFIFLIAGALYLFNVLDAHLSVHEDRKHENLERIPRRQKNPWFAVFVSRILPGLGHIYLKHSILGLIFLTLSLVFLQLHNFFPFLGFVVPLITAIALYDTYRFFSPVPSGYKRSFIAIMAGFVFLNGIITTYLPEWINQRVEQFLIPSPSMLPTLQIGDRILVAKSENYQPQRGDVVVFHPPEQIKAIDPHVSEFFIKRIVGLPGDTFEVYQGQVYIDGNPLSEPYIAEAPNYEMKPIKIPENAYFVLGDNRNDSIDSHIWGFLPEPLIFGHAYKITWPLGRINSLILP